MDKKSILQALDEGVGSLRGLLAENDGSTLKTIATSTKQGFNSLKAAFKENENAQKAMAEIKKHLDDLEDSVKKGDKKLSAKFLAAAEKKIRQCKKKYEKDSPSKPETKTKADSAKKPAKAPAKPKADAKAKPAEKARPAAKAPAKKPAAQASAPKAKTSQKS